MQHSNNSIQNNSENYLESHDVSRRDFLKLSSLAAIGMGTASALAPATAQANPPSKVIDCEFHYYLPSLMDYLATRTEVPRFYPDKGAVEFREGTYVPWLSTNNTHPMIEELMNFGEERIAEMDKHGTTVGVMSSSPVIEELPKKAAVHFAKKSNDAVAALIKKYPGRFMGAAVLPTPYVEESIKELERCKKELGFKYWHTHSNYGHEHLYNEKFLPLLAKAEELGCAFYLHPQQPIEADMNDMGYIYSSAGLGFGVDTMKTALRIILNGTFDKFPKLRMVLGHLGEYFPFIMDRLDNRFGVYRDPQVKMKQSVSYYFKNKNVLVTTSGNMSKLAFDCTVKAIGIDNILFGTDYPYESLAEMKKFVMSLGLSQEDKEKVFHLNAEKYIL